MFFFGVCGVCYVPACKWLDMISVGLPCDFPGKIVTLFAVQSCKSTGWWFQIFWEFSWEDSHFDEYFSIGLKPPIRVCRQNLDSDRSHPSNCTLLNRPGVQTFER